MSSSFWSPANVNWCEEDRPSFPVEMWNTISSVPMIFLGLYGYLRLAPGSELRISLSFFFLSLVGLGSTLFHGTLVYGFQLADELPMIYGSFFMIASWRVAEGTSTRNVVLNLLCAALITFLMLLWPDNHLPMNLAYGAQVVTAAAMGARRCISLKIPALSRLSFASMALFLTGFGLWLCDRLACPTFGTFRFHAWWHVLAGVGTFSWIQASAFSRAIVKKRKAIRVVRNKDIYSLPYIEFGK